METCDLRFQPTAIAACLKLGDVSVRGAFEKGLLTRTALGGGEWLRGGGDA